MPGMLRDIASQAVNFFGAGQRCEAFLATSGGESTIRNLTVDCRAGGVSITLTECVALVKQMPVTAGTNGQVTRR